MMAKKLSKDETREFLAEVERRAGCGLPYRADYDAFKDAFTVRELLTSALVALGYDRDWVFGEFDDQLSEAVGHHVQAVGQ